MVGGGLGVDDWVLMGDGWVLTGDGWALMGD